MHTKIFTATLIGLACQVVEVEVDYRNGLSHFSIVGLGDKSVQEAKERIVAAIKNAKADFTPRRITVNLAPADIAKTGPYFDLPIALGYLVASGQINQKNLDNTAFIGELSLCGELRPARGVISIVEGLKNAGFKRVIIPYKNIEEARLVPKIRIIPFSNLKQIIEWFRGKYVARETNNIVIKKQKALAPDTDFLHIRGQAKSKRALEVAAAGGHNVLLRGIPGAGKSMLAKAMPTIMPELTHHEALEVTKIHSIAGKLNQNTPLIMHRPFRAPHHSSTLPSIMGGGSIPLPGEITLAHKGILFLDELPEFNTKLIDSLRQPMESRQVTLARSKVTVHYPADFLLVAAMNPCKCGYLGSEQKQCTCTISQINAYRKRVSGPILDRFHIVVDILKINYPTLFAPSGSETSKTIKKRVTEAVNFQQKKLSKHNVKLYSQLSTSTLQSLPIRSDTLRYLQGAAKQLRLTARSYYSTLRVALTIASLGQTEINKIHIQEALSYRLREETNN